MVRTRELPFLTFQTNQNYIHHLKSMTMEVRLNLLNESQIWEFDYSISHGKHKPQTIASNFRTGGKNHGHRTKDGFFNICLDTTREESIGQVECWRKDRLSMNTKKVSRKQAIRDESSMDGKKSINVK